MTAPTRFSRDRVVAAAYAVAGESGVRNITFRAIARASGIALGTLTYHYKDRGEIIREVTLFARQRFAQRCRAALDRAGPGESLAAALAGFVEFLTCDSHAEMVVDYDFYLTGLSEPAAKPVCLSWMSETFAMLEDYLPPLLAQILTYQLEGMFLHAAKLGQRFPAETTRPIFDAILRGSDQR